MSQTTYTLSQLNGMDASQFVQVLGGVYEHSPWVAEQAATQRPFASAEALAAAMRNAVDTAETWPSRSRATTRATDTGMGGGDGGGPAATQRSRASPRHHHISPAQGDRQVLSSGTLARARAMHP